MFSGLLSGAKKKAVCLNCSGALKGSENGEISSLSPILGAHFRVHLSSAAVSHCPHFLKIRRLQGSEGPCLFCKGPFEA